MGVAAGVSDGGFGDEWDVVAGFGCAAFVWWVDYDVDAVSVSVVCGG